MTNNFDSNITRPLMRRFLLGVENKRVLSKAINTQLYAGKFNPASGDVVDVKRPHQYRAVETSTGDLTSSANNDIISGKATATVQNYITVPLQWNNKDEALTMDQLDEIVAPAVDEVVSRLEVNLGKFMVKNCNLSIGTPGTVVDAWADVASAGSLMQSLGVPAGDWYYAMNPFTQQNLASVQFGLNANPDASVKTAFEDAKIARKFAGLTPLSCNTLGTYTSGTASDRAGVLAAAPTATYVAHKDTMVQTLSCSGFSGGATFKAGEIVQITGRYRCNLVTREPIFDATGAQILFRGVITEDATSNTAGAVTLKIAGPGIFEANGQYNTITSALAQNDVITVLGSASTVYQPNMFFHKDAFVMATVKLPKLYATDTIGTTKDGISARITKWADGTKNTNSMRIDLLPAFGVMNPFFAGQGFGL